MKIETFKHPDSVWEARLPGSPYWQRGHGLSESEAIGDLLLCFPNGTGVEISRRDCEPFYFDLGRIEPAQNKK